MRRLWLKIVLLLLLLMTAATYADTPSDVVVRWMHTHYDLDTLEYEIEVLAVQLRTTEVEPAQVQLRALSLSEPLGLFTVLAEIWNENRLVERGQIRLRVKKYDSVLVASDRLKRHELLAANKLLLKRMDVTSLREQPVNSLDQINGFRLKRNLSKGKILTLRLIEPVPDIEVGQEVSIVFSDDLCTITASGRVLQTGSVGDCVKVKNTASGKIVTARIVDSVSVAVGL